MLQRLARSALDLRGTPRSTLTATHRATRTFAVLAVATLTFAAAVTATLVPQAEARTGAASAATLSVSELPAEGQKTYRLIRAGGPFPFEKDGVVFGNREKLLPPFQRGYYHEYTVATPQARDRGARRIVCGGARRDPERCYYTADHYSSFREIVE